MLVDVKTELYEKVKKLVKEKKIDYASIQQFVNLAVKQRLKLEEEKSKVN